MPALTSRFGHVASPVAYTNNQHVPSCILAPISPCCLNKFALNNVLDSLSYPFFYHYFHYMTRQCLKKLPLKEFKTSLKC